MPPRRDMQLRRVYDDDDRGGTGYRVLVDRLWPRGLSKADVALDEWLKDAAPSTELRRWYGHDVTRFSEFARRYRRELQQLPGSAAVDHLIELTRTRTVTLVTATHDVEHSGARVLHDRLAGGSSPSAADAAAPPPSPRGRRGRTSRPAHESSFE